MKHKRIVRLLPICKLYDKYSKKWHFENTFHVSLALVSKRAFVLIFKLIRISKIGGGIFRFLLHLWLDSHTVTPSEIQTENPLRRVNKYLKFHSSVGCDVDFNSSSTFFNDQLKC